VEKYFSLVFPLSFFSLLALERFLPGRDVSVQLSLGGQDSSPDCARFP